MKKERINYFKYFSLFFALAVLVLIAGCSGTPPAVPIINAFSASPSIIITGESSTLSWSVTDAASVTIDHGVGTVVLLGSTVVTPATTTTYILTATNVAGSVTAQAMVMVSSALTVTYDGNGATAGTVPAGPYSYQTGATVTVFGNTGDLIRICSGGTSYYFTGWDTKADGNGNDQAEGSTFTMGTFPVTLYAQWTPYVLRDIGPAGGYIFYDKGVYSKADLTIVKAGNDTVKTLPPIMPLPGSWRYLEAAYSDESTVAPWGLYATLISGADGTAVGTGEQNTIDIEAGCAVAGTAADICANLSLGGCDDWFLPSTDELYLMYTNLKLQGVGGFTADLYWSSSEYGADHAWSQGFDDGLQDYYDKYVNYRVRAVRAF